MSVRISSGVWSESKVKDGAFVVLLYLADMANDEGVCWPSQAKIATNARMSERNVRRALDDAVAAGELEVQKAKRGRSRFNVYRVLLGSPLPVSYDDLPIVLEGRFADDRPDCPVVEVPRPDISDTDDRTPTSAYPLEDPSGEKPLSTASPPTARRDVVFEVLIEQFGPAVTAGERADYGRTVKEVKEALELGGLTEFSSDEAKVVVARAIAPRVEAMGDYRSHRSLRNRWTALGEKAVASGDLEADRPLMDEVAEPPPERKLCACIPNPHVDAPVPDPECPDCGGTGIDGWCS